MKKAYMKPGMYVENFSLAQSIAAGCSAQHNSTLGGPAQGSKTTCAWDVGGLFLWTSTTPACDVPAGDSAEAGDEIICYNNPNGGQTVFAS